MADTVLFNATCLHQQVDFIRLFILITRHRNDFTVSQRVHILLRGKQNRIILLQPAPTAGNLRRMRFLFLVRYVFPDIKPPTL